MGLLDNVLSTIDAKKRSVKRGLMDMLDNPSQWAGMQANRIQEDRYGGAENAQAMKQYLTKQPYDPKALTAANDALRNAAINESLGAVTAWHGSPHKFDKFDSSKIGTGEGAQAYGHGLYLAENEAVSKGYMRAGETAAPIQFNGEGIMNWALGNRDKVAAMPKVTQQSLAFARDFSSIDEAARMARMNDMPSVEGELRRLAAGGLLKDSPPGNLYKVDIPDEAVAKFLDWDKPLSQQSKEVQAALQKAGISVDKQALGQFDDALLSALEGTGSTTLPRHPINPAGESVYRKLGGPDVAADKLRALGIPGIRYLDGGSRGAGAGTSNYVLFDDKLPRILETNGKPTGLQPWAKGEWEGLLGK